MYSWFNKSILILWKKDRNFSEFPTKFGGWTFKQSTYLSTMSFVNIKSRLKYTGLLCSWFTALSINGCERIKLSTVSGKLDVSSTHVPGLGSGIFDFKTGNQAEVDDACSLNFPAIKHNRNKPFLYSENQMKWKQQISYRQMHYELRWCQNCKQPNQLNHSYLLQMWHKISFCR